MGRVLQNINLPRPQVFDARDFGLVPNDPSHDNVRALQAAYDRAALASASSGGPAIVALPAGTIHLAAVHGPFSIMVFPRSNVWLVGQGDATVLRVADGLNGIGRTFRVLGWVESTELVGAQFRDFLVDCNGANNLVPSAEPGKPNQAIIVNRGREIVVERVTVRNNPGRQCFLFGANTSPHTIRNLKIIDCRIRNVGTAVPGNTAQTDHSAIYAQADVCTIRGCELSNDVMAGEATAIESYSSNAQVYDNSIDEFGTGFNVVALTVDQEHSKYFANNVRARRAVRAWCDAPHALRDVRIYHNTLIQAASSVNNFLDFDSQVVGGDVDEIVIEENTIVGEVSDWSRNLRAVILGRVRRVDVRRNLFRSISGAAVALGTTLANELDLRVDENRMVDCGRTTESGDRRSFIKLNTLDGIRYLSIRGNEIGGTVVTTGDTASGSDTITNVADTTLWNAGDAINGAGIPDGATVLSVGVGTLTISVNATATAASVTIFSFGRWGVRSNATIVGGAILYNDTDQAIGSDGIGAPVSLHTGTTARVNVVRDVGPPSSAANAVAMGNPTVNNALVVQSVGGGIAQFVARIGTADRGRLLFTADQLQIFADNALRWTVRNTFLQPASTYDIGSAGSGGVGRYFVGGAGGPFVSSGTGDPEGSLAAPVGSLFLRTDGGAGTTLYVKESGAGNTGWAAK